MPSRETIATYYESLEHLIADKNWLFVLRTFHFALQKTKTLHHFTELAQFMADVPPEVRCSQAWLEISLQIACNGRNPDLILEMQQQLSSQAQQKSIAYWAWALRKKQRCQEALSLLETDFTTLLNLGLAWRIRGECQMVLQQPGWFESLSRACEIQHGRALGITRMEFGSYCFLAGKLQAAQTQYNQAYALLKHDPYYAAWIKYNLGLVTLELHLPEAEQHFYTAQIYSKNQQATEFQARAWCGLGAVRRSQGQYARAEFAYKRGIEQALELDDRLAAYCGLAQTQRCQSKLNQALEQLYIAIDLALEVSPETDKVRILLIAALLQRGDLADATQHLGLLESTPSGESSQRFLVIQAELQRLAGDLGSAATTLRQTDATRQCIREESQCFRALFALASSAVWSVKALPKAKKIKIEVRALGVLEVRLGQQIVPLKPTSKIAELLVLLLEHDGHASAEMLCQALYPTQTIPRKAQQALWGLSKQLREVLGWEESIQAKNKAYILQQDNVIWHYDARDQPKMRLLEGVYSNWVEELRQLDHSSSR